MDMKLYQQETIDKFLDTGHVAIVANRQQGVTTCLRMLIEYQLSLEPNSRIWVCVCNPSVYERNYLDLEKKYSSIKYAGSFNFNSFVKIKDVLDHQTNRGFLTPDVIVADSMFLRYCDYDQYVDDIKTASGCTSEFPIYSWAGEDI